MPSTFGTRGPMGGSSNTSSSSHHRGEKVITISNEQRGYGKLINDDDF